MCRRTVHASASISTISLDALQATKMRRPSADGCAHVGEHVFVPGGGRLAAVAGRVTRVVDLVAVEARGMQARPGGPPPARVSA